MYVDVVVAKLVERLLPIPEVCGSNPVIVKINIEHLFTVNCIVKKKKEKEARNCTFLIKQLGRYVLKTHVKRQMKTFCSYLVRSTI